MASFNTLYAALMRRREQQQQQQLEQSRYNDQRYDQAVAQNQALTQADEQAKQAEFDRKLKVAELMGKAAGTTGQAKPQGFENPAVQEWANASYGGGRAQRQLEAEKRRAELQKQARGALFDIKETPYGSTSQEAETARSAIASKELGYNIPSLIDRTTPAQRARATGKDPSIDLRKEFENRPVVKEFYESAPQYERIMAATPDGAGDLALIMGFARLIEPRARTVTDQDFSNVANSGAFGDKIKNAIQYYWHNGGRLDDTVRANIRNEAGLQFQATQRSAKADADWYTKTVLPEYGVAPELVIHPRIRLVGAQTAQPTHQGLAEIRAGELRQQGYSPAQAREQMQKEGLLQ